MADVSFLQKGGGRGIGFESETWHKMFLWLGAILVIAALGFGILVYVQKSSLTKTKSSIETEIQNVFKQEEINKLRILKTFNQSVQVSKAAKNNHSYASSVFAFLENITLSQVAFSSFSFNLDKLSVSLDASAASYTIMAKQIDAMEKDSRIKSVQVSGIGLDPLSGAVRFLLNIELDPSVVKR